QGQQSFFANQTTQGRYLDTSTFRLQQSASGCNGATITWSISQSNAYPWSVASELANLTASITSTSSATTTSVTIDWSNGQIANAAPFTFGTPTAKTGGTTVAIGGASFLGAFPPSMAAGGTYYLHWYVAGAPGTCTIMYSSSDKYPSGSVYIENAGAWAQQAASDLSGWVVNVYGGVSALYTFSATDKHVGGAYYAYICEVQKDATPQQYNFTSSFGGRAKATGYQAVGVSICTGVVSAINGNTLQQTIQEWRIGYDTIPRNASASLTITFDTGGSSRNLVYVGLFAGSQPTHLHLSGPNAFANAGRNSITPYVIFSTDDFFTQLDFTVKECAATSTDCSTYGNTSTTAAYVITICPGTFQRQVSGTVNSTGHAVVTGQDIPGCLVTITLTGSNATGAAYSSTTWTNTIGSAGSYSFTVGVFFASTTGGAFQLGALSVTFSGNFTRVIPDAINITINRTRADDLYVDCVRLDPNTGAVRSACTVDEWGPTETNSYYRANQYQGFVYPQSIRTTTISGDAGTYVVYVVNSTRFWFGSQAFCIYTSWTAAACSANVGADLQGQLATDTLN